MNKKSLFISAGILVFCLMAYAVLRMAAHRPVVIRPFKSIAVSDISRVQILKSGEDFTLEKKDGRWAAVGLAAFVLDEESFGQALKGFEELEIKEVISENSEKFSRFDVSEGSGTVLRVFAVSKSTESKALDITLGKNSPNYLNYYAKLADENKVRLFSGLNKYAFENPKASWRNKVISKFDKDSFISAEVARGKNRYEIIKSSDEFLVNGRQIERQNADAFVHSVNNLRSYDYADEADLKTAGIEPKPAIKIIIKSSEGDYTLKIGGMDKDKSKYHIVRENDPTIYFLAKNYVDTIEQSIEKFKQNPK